MALTEICNDVNAVGAVSVFASSTFTALTDGDFYLFEVGVITTSAGGTLNLYINSDTTDANYGSGFIQSDGTQTIGAQSVRATPDAASNITVISGYIGVFKGKPWIIAQVLDEGATERAQVYGVINTPETSITQLRVSASAAIIADDSYIKVWPVSDLATVADVTVSGGSVQTLSTGAFTALSEGKTYLLMSQVERGITDPADLIKNYINGDTTDANYDRGYLTSAGVATDNSGNFGHYPRANGDISISVGYCGILNGVPFFSQLSFSERSTPSDFMVAVSHYNPSEVDFDQFQLTGGASTTIANGSRILIKEFA